MNIISTKIKILNSPPALDSQSAKLSCTVQIHISEERTLSYNVISSLQVTLRCAVFSSVASVSLDRRWGKIVRVSIQNFFLKRQSVKFTAMKGQFFGGKYRRRRNEMDISPKRECALQFMHRVGLRWELSKREFFEAWDTLIWPYFTTVIFHFNVFLTSRLHFLNISVEPHLASAGTVAMFCSRL